MGSALLTSTGSTGFVTVTSTGSTTGGPATLNIGTQTVDNATSMRFM
jgi:hypothetical protein